MPELKFVGLRTLPPIKVNIYTANDLNYGFSRECKVSSILPSAAGEEYTRRINTAKADQALSNHRKGDASPKANKMPYFILPRVYTNKLLQSLVLALSLCALGPALCQAQSGAADALGSEVVKKVEKRIRAGLQKEQQQREKVGKKAAELIAKTGRTRTITIDGKSFPESPQQHPLLANDGADPSGKSKDEYTRYDSEAIFNDQTFAQCLEDRQVSNGTYMSECSKICPGPWVRVEPNCPKCKQGDPGCVYNEYYVSELYFPVYETRTYSGRAMGSFDPNGDYLSGKDKRADLKLKSTKQRIAEQGKQSAETALEAYLGKGPSSVSDKLYPDWYTPEIEWYGHDGDQPNDGASPSSFHSLTYQTNVHRQATRRRPKDKVWEGFRLQDNCLFHTLDNPAKKVIADGSYGDPAFIRAAMSADESKKIESEGAKATLPSGGPNIYQLVDSLEAKNGKLPSELQGLPPSQRMSEWSWMKTGLERVGVSARSLEDKYVFYGHELMPFTSSRDNAWVDPFYAAISHGFSHYMLTSLPTFAGNKENQRALRFSYHKNRGSRPNYTGEDSSVKENIIFTDKMQIIFPPWEESGERRGSHCFRPETMERIEPSKPDGSLARRIAKTTDSGHFSIPREIRKRFPEKGSLENGLADANEVRIAYYQKRVNCYCTQCGVKTGCTVLNDGDLEKDSFYGTTPLKGGAAQLTPGGTVSAPSPKVQKAVSKSLVTGSPRGVRRSSRYQQSSISKGASSAVGGPAVQVALKALGAAAVSPAAIDPEAPTVPLKIPASETGTPGTTSPGGVELAGPPPNPSQGGGGGGQFPWQQLVEQIVALACKAAGAEQGGGPNAQSGGCGTGECSIAPRTNALQRSRLSPFSGGSGATFKLYRRDKSVEFSDGRRATLLKPFDYSMRCDDQACTDITLLDDSLKFKPTDSLPPPPVEARVCIDLASEAGPTCRRLSRENAMGTLDVLARQSRVSKEVCQQQGQSGEGSGAGGPAMEILQQVAQMLTQLLGSLLQGGGGQGQQAEAQQPGSSEKGDSLKCSCVSDVLYCSESGRSTFFPELSCAEDNGEISIAPREIQLVQSTEEDADANVEPEAAKQFGEDYRF